MKAFMLARSSTRSRLLKQQERLKYIAHELDKLSERHDRESLASIQIRFEILAFHQDSDSNFEQAYRQNVLDSGISKAQSMVASRTTRQSYVKDGFGWENFLRPSAPGFGLMHSETQPPSSVQVLPSMGMRICADLGRDEVDCIQASQVGSTSFAFYAKLIKIQDQVKRGNRALHRLPFIEVSKSMICSVQTNEGTAQGNLCQLWPACRRAGPEQMCTDARRKCKRHNSSLLKRLTMRTDDTSEGSVYRCGLPRALIDQLYIDKLQDLGVRLNIGTHSAVKPFQELSRFICELKWFECFKTC